MRVFVAGATGVLGKALLPALVSAGYEVYGLARTPEKLLMVEQMGARSVRGDVLNAPDLCRHIAAIQPECIVNLATAIPLRLRIQLKDWELNDRVRTEGTANLLTAARETSLRLFVQESVGYVCAAQGAAWIEENAPLSNAPFVRATQEMEQKARVSGLPVTLLRLGALVSAESWHTQQSIAALRRGLLPILGAGDFYVSQIHADDAAQAIFCALAQPNRAAQQTYHVVDNEPVQMQEMLPYAAFCLNAPPPRKVPVFMAKMMVGALTVELFTASYRLSNAKIRHELGFAPRYPTYRESWSKIAQAVGSRDFTPSPDLS
jgi:nucleoside-diphosphate-sugar epimerase